MQFLFNNKKENERFSSKEIYINSIDYIEKQYHDGFINTKEAIYLMKKTGEFIDTIYQNTNIFYTEKK